MESKFGLGRSDAWLLCAVFAANEREDATLQEVISASDWINHAILGFEEIDGGIARLEHAGLLTMSEHRFRATEVAREIYRSAREGRQSVFDVLNAIGDAIGAPRLSHDTARPGETVKSGAFTRDEWRAAVDSYQSKFAAELRRLDEQNG